MLWQLRKQHEMLVCGRKPQSGLLSQTGLDQLLWVPVCAIVKFGTAAYFATNCHRVFFVLRLVRSSNNGHINHAGRGTSGRPPVYRYGFAAEGVLQESLRWSNPRGARTLQLQLFQHPVHQHRPPQLEALQRKWQHNQKCWT